jgi:lysophospholipase L1-like esterase
MPDMSLSDKRSERRLTSPGRDLFILPAVFVIILIELQMNVGTWRFIYPVLAVSLFSPFALKVWAVILVGWTLLVSAVSWGPQDWIMSSGLPGARIAFVWVMLVLGRLLATHRIVRTLGRMLAPHAGALRKLLVAAAAVMILSLIFFAVPHPYLLVGLAALLAYVTTRIPKPAAGVRTRTKAGAAEIGLVGGSVIVCLALFELLLRLFIPAPPAVVDGIYEPHPEAIFLLAENASILHSTEEFNCRYVISDQGFRDHHYGSKDESAFRILCCGDSFTMGQGVSVDEVYAKVIEKMFADRNLDMRVEVVNAGTGGHGVWQQAIMLKERGLPLSPDAIILEIHPQTDIRDALASAGKVMRSYDTAWQFRLREFRRLDTRRVKNMLYRRSRAVGFVYERYQLLRTQVLQCLRARFRRSGDALPRPEDDRPWWWESSLVTYYPELQEGWRLLEESICEIADICREKGIELVVFAVPAHEEVSRTSFKIMMRTADFDLSLYDLNKTARLVRDICQRNAIDFVDILPRFREESERGETLYYQADGHFNAAGHTLCAEILYEHLMKTYLNELAGTSSSGQSD